MSLLSKKKTPNPEELYNACKTNNRAEVTRLIDAKCDPQAHADPFTGDVCLHVCANKNRYELMETLLKAGADADKQNKVTGPCVPSSRRLASSVPSGTLTLRARCAARPNRVALRRGVWREGKRRPTARARRQDGGGRGGSNPAGPRNELPASGSSRDALADVRRCVFTPRSVRSRWKLTRRSRRCARSCRTR